MCPLFMWSATHKVFVCVNPSLPGQVAEKVLALANALLDDGGAEDAGTARAAAQLMAASACLGSESWPVKARVGPQSTHDWLLHP
jgi:hypothetical protein